MPKAILSSLLFLAVMLTAQTTNIAVIDFVGNNVSQADTKALTDRLRAELFQTGKFTVLEREKMDVILNEQQFQLTGCTSDACAVEVGQLLAVQQMVSGSISQVGQTFSVTARLINVEKGNLISVGKCDLKGDIGDLLTCLNEVAAQLAGNKVIATSKPTEAPAKSDVLPEMVFVEGGTFQMGSNSGYSSEKPAHNVTVKGFWMGKYEVTQAEYNRVMGTNPSYFKCDGCPVENVSWEDAAEYARRVGGRLPTEAEWEYAARGGNKSRGYQYSGSNNLDEVGWYENNSGGETHPVGQKKPNELGLYDMTGNVGEWCSDRYDAEYYKKSPQVDPQGPSSGTKRVVRGGSCFLNVYYCRLADRNRGNPDGRDYDIGFRFVRDF